MDSMKAFAMGEANRGKEEMVFDWDKAAQLVVDRKPSVVLAGLKGDWRWTGGEIYRYGKPLSRDESYTFLASTWAIPEIDIDGEVIECFKMEHEVPGWGSGTFWPESALAIINAIPSA